MTKNILLEPWYEFKLEVPTDSIGRAMTDIQQMGGRFSQPENNGVDMTVISGSAPVSGMMDYQSEVSMYTKGRGRLTCLPNGYEPCNNSDELLTVIVNVIIQKLCLKNMAMILIEILKIRQILYFVLMERDLL